MVSSETRVEGRLGTEDDIPRSHSRVFIERFGHFDGTVRDPHLTGPTGGVRHRGPTLTVRPPPGPETKDLEVGVGGSPRVVRLMTQNLQDCFITGRSGRDLRTPGEDP